VLVSPPQRDVGALSRTLRSLGRIRDAAPGVTVVGGTPVSTVIDELRDDVHVRDFAARLLEPLLDYDHRHDGDLVETTAAVLRHPSSRSAVAEDLHLSRTSLYSRIATIERLLGMDLGDGETQFALGLALRTR
jgi:purine catabolism regulator